MMRILFTGASSFTGAWFARALRDRGAELVLACRGTPENWSALQRTRLAMLGEGVEIHTGCAFGSPRFLALLQRRGPFDLLALHGAQVGDHRNPAFDPVAALAANTRGLDAVLDRLLRGGRVALLVTGSLFEADEGQGERPLRAFNPYGLSKTLTWHAIRFAAESRGLTLGKFTLGNPFGPLEKPNLPSALARAWLAGEIPVIRQPDLVRDHAPVELLAEAYARFALSLPARPGIRRLNPSCFAEPLLAFAERLAAAMRPRLARPCRLRHERRPAPCDEPRVRVNTDPLPELVPDWDFAAFWDRLADWYRRCFADGAAPVPALAG